MSQGSAGTHFGRPYNLCPHDSGMLIEDVWPSIYFGLERVEEIRRKTSELEWAKAALDQMLREAETVLTTEPSQPIERVGWRHDFYARTTGEHLVYDPDSPWQYLDPCSGRFESLEEQRRAWVLFTHERTLRLMRSLGILYQITGDERLAAWIADGMRRAVEMFTHDELREGNNTDALYFQPLYDAPVLMMLADAYEMTRESAAYDDADHEAIRTGIFEKGLPYQITFLDSIGVHNMSCFVAGALGKSGFLFDRDDWLQRGLNYETNDLRNLLIDCVRAGEDGEVDGFWFEGTMFYHHYSLCPLITLFELAKRFGAESARDLEVLRRFEQMFAAPVDLADANLRLPTVGDLGAPKVMSVCAYRHLYEYAAGQVNPERFGPTLSAIYSRGYPRNSLTALAFGPDELPEPQFPRGATLLKRPGMGVMRADDGWALLFKVGPHGAGHDHQDKLELALNACGKAIAPDLGTAGYALTEIHPYYRSTFSHNTLFVDESGQANVSDCEMVWRPDAEPAYARGTVRDAYEGVELTRHVWFDPPYVIVMDECASAEPHRYGWQFHALGSMHGGVSREIEGEGLPGIEMLDKHMSGARSRWTDGHLEANWRVEEGLWLRLLATSDGPFQATLGRTPGNPMPDDRGTVVLRAPGTVRSFWAAFEVHGGCAQAAAVVPSDDGLQLELADGTSRVYTKP